MEWTDRFLSKSMMTSDGKKIFPNSLTVKVLPTCLAPLITRGFLVEASFQAFNFSSKNLFMKLPSSAYIVIIQDNYYIIYVKIQGYNYNQIIENVKDINYYRNIWIFYF